MSALGQKRTYPVRKVEVACELKQNENSSLGVTNRLSGCRLLRCKPCETNPQAVFGKWLL